MSEANIKISADLTNPGQFYACCGLLELADRSWPGCQAWFEPERFALSVKGTSTDRPLATLLQSIASSTVGNTMSVAAANRLEQLAAMLKRERNLPPALSEEKKELESLRREEPILLSSPICLRIDWFRDDDAGGSRFKTWAGQQSVLDITSAMKDGIISAGVHSESTFWNSARGIGLPFNFDSDLGSQGSALDVGFSFDPLASSEATRIEGACRPMLELLSFVGLQRFRPRELLEQNRFAYLAWHTPLPASVAAAVACGAVSSGKESCYEFRLLYRTKYLKSFLPAIPFQGERNE